MMLRLFLGKFNIPLSHGVVREMSVPCTGTSSHTEGTTEAMCRDHLDIDLAWKDMEVREPWNRHADRLGDLASVAGQNPGEMQSEHSSKGKSRPRILVAAASWDRYQWYDNNVHLVTSLDAGSRALLASGTCGNEALHAELRGSFWL